MEKAFKLGVIGAGNMGMAIVNGAVQHGMYAKNEILLWNRSEEKRRAKADLGYSVTDDFRQVYAKCETVILSVKPQNFPELMPQLAAVQTDPMPLVITIAAGISLSYIEGFLGDNVPMVRVMPNTPLMLGCGASALAKNAACPDEALQRVQAVFDALGVTAVFEQEDAINDIIPANGSAPAYVYYFIDAMAKNAEKHGIDRQSALKLICKTFEGSARMVLESGKTPDVLIQEVCSPGGTTIEAIRVLNSGRVDKIIDEASDKCIKRAYELGK